jgi:UDP-N-acetylmuramoylalanine--D-glutamate ligase
LPRSLTGVKRVAVLGAGRSGLAVIRLLRGHGARAFLSDHREIPLRTKGELEALNTTYEEGGHTLRVLDGELIVLSPSVPSDLPILSKARQRGIPIIGELELAYRLCRSKKIIAVTGTNGKSTTTRLIGELLHTAGYQVIVAGNIGNPLSGELERIDEKTIVILEVSSFQLETIERFHPWVSLFLNFAPDHLERHGTIEEYFSVKCRIFSNQTDEDFALVQERLLPSLPRLRPQVLTFMADDLPPLADGLFPHQREDLAAALRAARLVDPQIDLSKIDLDKALALPHRLQLVAEAGGVRFYDDSKATNVAATLAALDSFPNTELTLILGGRAKGESFAPLAKTVRERGIVVLLIGKAAEEIARELERVGHRGFLIEDLQEGVRLASQLKRKVCLLSPACASFDMFADYRERGRAFQQAVRGYLARSSPSGDTNGRD